MAQVWLRAAVVAALALWAQLALGEEEEKPKVSKVNVGISVMLLGSIGFMMALFELTHCYNKTMAMYSWKAISATISIFSAVLIFQGFNGLVEAYILDGASERMELIVNFLHMFVWFMFLQAALAMITGVLPVKGFDPRLDDHEVMESRLKTFAILLGHTTGFAAINAFATLQQQVPRSPAMCFLVAPLVWMLIWVLGRLTDTVREHVALIGDGVKEKHEEMWDEETEETEDDVVGLAVSFCFVQACRFWLGGSLPNAEGEESAEVVAGHSMGQAFGLISIGFLLACMEAFRVIFVKSTFERLTPQMKNIIAMTFSWCIFFGTDWYLSATIFLREQGMMKQVTLALTVTIVALLMIFCMEQVQNFKHLDDTLDQAIRAIVNAIGILIGVAWEKAFDVAVAEVTETVHVLPAPLTKIILSIVLAGTVVPAWYRHILPNIILIEAMEKGEGEEGEGEHESGHKKAGAAAEEGHAVSLKEPLLSGPSAEEAQLRATLEQYQKKVAELEGESARANELEIKYRELEENISTISKELGDLQKIADVLVTS